MAGWSKGSLGSTTTAKRDLKGIRDLFLTSQTLGGVGKLERLCEIFWMFGLLREFFMSCTFSEKRNAKIYETSQKVRHDY